ncbi:hypothetical protein MPER_08515, partial [Moniliophthora perniciosa FA553]
MQAIEPHIKDGLRLSCAQIDRCLNVIEDANVSQDTLTLQVIALRKEVDTLVEAEGNVESAQATRLRERLRAMEELEYFYQTKAKAHVRQLEEQVQGMMQICLQNKLKHLQVQVRHMEAGRQAMENATRRDLGELHNESIFPPQH